MCNPRIGRTLLLACCLSALASSSLCAQETAGIKWRSDYVAAKKESEAKNLPMLIDVWKTACAPCVRMEEFTFRDPRIVTALNGKFIPLRINGPENPKLNADLGINLYPTVVLAGPDGRIAQTLVGFQEADVLNDHLQRLVATLTPPDTMKREFETAQKWEASGDFASAIKGLNNILDTGKDPGMKKNALELLRKIEKGAGDRLNAAKALHDKGQTQEALEALTEVTRMYEGLPASRQALDLRAQFSRVNAGAKAAQRAKRARDLYLQAQEFYNTKDYVPCLYQCRAIISNYGDLPEGQQAFLLSSKINNNREWLQGAADMTTDLLGNVWLSLADTNLKQGNVQSAQTVLQKVIDTFPGSRMAESAQIRLQQLRGIAPAPKGVERAGP